MRGTAVQIAEWRSPQARTYVDELLCIYRLAFLELHSADPERAAQLRRAQTRQVIDRPGFRAMVALDADELVGFAFSCPGMPGQWWHDVVVGAMPRPAATDWLADSLEIVELHVLPSHQGRGIGRRLLRDSLARTECRTAVLSALEEPDSPARHLYAMEGFEPLLERFRFPGSPERYAVLGKRLL
jgi:ribosomal protein S18 acetylase RimI-like enzyme